MEANLRRAANNLKGKRNFQETKMSNTIRHCPACSCQSLHLHKHDVNGTSHVHGSERFECSRCGSATFAHSESAFRFPFFNDAPEQRSAFGLAAMVRP